MPDCVREQTCRHDCSGTLIESTEKAKIRASVTVKAAELKDFLRKFLE